jgi:hypothetical protein
MSFETPPAPTAAAAPPPPPMYAQDKKAGKQRPKSMQPTALASGSVPEVTALGNKTLLGQ